jgi:hypothetical protein
MGGRLAAVAAAVVAAASTSGALAFQPPQNPPWAPTWNMSLSTLTMACNSSGWYNLTVASAFGIVSYDW